jgi:lipopolysaccharide transport system permease protein/teichoic acid transport system permease protein
MNVLTQSGPFAHSPAVNALRRFVDFLRDLVRSREVILTMTHRDFTSRYLGSCLGLVWAFIQPLANILVIWFVFQVGFKAAPINDFPFILWLSAGMIPWTFFSEAFSRATNSVVEKSCVVKKVCFRASMLPIVAILSTLIVHVAFIGVLLAMFAYYGYLPGLHAVQLVYYLGATLLMLLGLSWLTSSLTVFFRDVPQIVGLVLQFGFWATPVFWQPQQMPENIRWIVILNPMHYIVAGYRHALIDEVWFWEDPQGACVFWGFTLLCFLLGSVVFTRLRPHFADAL